MAKRLADTDDAALAFAADLELAKREARAGQPWEFIRIQWPHLLVSPAERRFFQTDFRLDHAQVEILTYLFASDHVEEDIKGCTKYGKGFAVALGFNIWFDIYPDCRAVLIGPSFEHSVDVMFSEIVSIRNQMRAAGPGTIQSEGIVDKKNTKHVLTIVNPKTGEGFSGRHSPKTLIIYDEASAVPDLFYEQGLKQADFVIALSNPRTLSGWFRHNFGEYQPDENKSVPTPRGKRRLITASGSKTVNVRNKRLSRPISPTGGIVIDGTFFPEGDTIPPECYEHVRPLIASQIDYARYLEIMSDRDESKRMIYGEGFFPKEDIELQVILSSWLDLHKQVWNEGVKVSAFGLDVAASEHGDKTICAAGSEEGCLRFHERQRADVMQTTGWLIRLAEEIYHIDLKSGQTPVAVDYGGGYGRGCGDRLKEQGVWVIPVIPNSKSRIPMRYENVRAELYGELGQRLNPNGPFAEHPLWAIPDDPEVFEEIAAHEKITASDGIRFSLIPKEAPRAGYTGKTIKDKLGRSPDKSDALVCLWRAVVGMFQTDDTRTRHLVVDLSTAKPDNAPETPEERFRRERAELFNAVAARMDGDDRNDFGW